MAEASTITHDAETETLSQGQLVALKAMVRASAESNPAGKNKGQRCSDIARGICSDFGVCKLADIPASAFAQATQAAQEAATPAVTAGSTEQTVRDAKAAHLDAVLSEIQQAKYGVAAFRREAEQALLAPLTALPDASGMGQVAHVVRENVGYLIAEPMLLIEEQLRQIQRTLVELSHRLPAIGRLLDTLSETPRPTMGAD